MTASGRNLPNLSELALPARDLARGLKHALARSRGLAPVRDALPGPLRDLARGLATEVEALAGSARGAAARFRPVGGGKPRSLAEISGGRDPALHFAKAAGYGLGFALRRMGRDDLMVSETVAAVAYRSAASGSDGDADPSQVAARLALALTHHHAAGAVPGTPIGAGEAESRRLLLAAYAVMLWMTVERSATHEDEDALLALCVDLTVAQDDEIATAAADPARLAALVAGHADLV